MAPSVIVLESAVDVNVPSVSSVMVPVAGQAPAMT